MKKLIIRAVLLSALIIILVTTNMPLGSRNESTIYTLPGLPRPIGKQPVIITSAGQNTDIYIISDIASQLMIGSLFMPQAKASDLQDMNTIVFVVGYSSLGTKLQDISYEDEKERVEQLIEKARENNMTVLTVVVSNVKANDKKTKELLELVCSHTNYMIGIHGSGNQDIMAGLAKERDIPLTLVEGVNDISGPFASAFR